MHAERLACYLGGGRPRGGVLTYPGCRDGRPPGRAVPVLLPGVLYFALESVAWTGGMGFYDPDRPGRMPARAYLVTAEQFSDIAAQEMYRPPGTDLDLAAAVARGRDRLGPGRYETLVCPGAIDGTPVLTVTAPWGLAGAALSPPSARYLRSLASGLGQAHGWSRRHAARYLASRPGADGHWTPAGVLDALRDRPPAP
ncbi:histone deacetylase [Kitasatospora sp. NPDC054939]